MTPTLADRLEDGWRLIDQTRDPGERERLTDHWLELVKQYQDEQDPTLWFSPAMHAWEPHTSARSFSPVQRAGGTKECATAVVQQSMRLRA